MLGDIPRKLMKVAFEHHGGERWEAVGCTKVEGGENPVEEAFALLRHEGSVILPRGVYRVRCLPDGAWQVGELRADGDLVLDQDELGSLSKAL